MKTKTVIKYTLAGEFVEEFESIAEASRFEEISKGSITANLSGKSKTCHGHIWKAKEEGE